MCFFSDQRTNIKKYYTRNDAQTSRHTLKSPSHQKHIYGKGLNFRLFNPLPDICLPYLFHSLQFPAFKLHYYFVQLRALAQNFYAQCFGVALYLLHCLLPLLCSLVARGVWGQYLKLKNVAMLGGVMCSFSIQTSLLFFLVIDVFALVLSEYLAICLRTRAIVIEFFLHNDAIVVSVATAF